MAKTMSQRKLEKKGASEDAMLPKSASARLFGYVSLGIIIVITLFPLWWMLRTALSTTKTLFRDPLSLLPVDFTLGGFNRVFGLASTSEALAEGGSGASINFAQFFVNSMIVCVVVTVSQVLFSAAAAYAFSILKWKGRDAVFF